MKGGGGAWAVWHELVDVSLVVVEFLESNVIGSTLVYVFFLVMRLAPC